MTFSLTEIYCLNSLIDSSSIFGVPFQNNGETPEMQEMDYILENLVEKNVLNSSKKLTPLSIPVVESIRLYKAAEEYIFLNNLRVSINSDASVTIFIRRGNEYELVRTHSQNLLLIIQSSFPSFFSVPKSENEIAIELNVSENDWEKKYNSEGFTSFLAIGKYKTGNPFPISEKIYASNEEKQFIYDLKKEEVISSSNIISLDIEKQLSILSKEGVY